MKTICRRLRRGEDLLEQIEKLACENDIEAGVVLSAVGCTVRARVRDASGVDIRDIAEPCEIVSLNGTVSAKRTHLHIALAKTDLSVVGGHLVGGCEVNTTCELIIGVLEGVKYGVENDGQTGYDEIVFV